MLSLFERMRPKRWEEVLGQDKAVKTLQRMESRGGLAGKSYWVSGKSGCGKTSIGRLIAASAADDWSTYEFTDPSELNAAMLERLRSHKDMRPLGKGYAYILNEAHLCSNALIGKLLGLTEPGCDWITWVFTTTIEGEKGLFEDCIDASPLMSRCIKLPLQSRRQALYSFAFVECPLLPLPLGEGFITG